MQSSELICQRFSAALDRLVADKVIRGRATFCKATGIDRRNLYAVLRNPATRNLPALWLSALVENYNVSAQYLLTGEGEIFNNK